MYLIKNKEESIHGVDYIKGLENGVHCGKIHKYQTKNCRPVLYKREDLLESQKNDVVDYNSLSDREQLELGEPVFFKSSLFYALQGGQKQLVEYHHSLTYDSRGNVINESLEDSKRVVSV